MSLASPRSIAIGAERLTIADVDDVAGQRGLVHLAREASVRLLRAYEFVQQLAAAGTPVYGLTTGCGPLASQPIPADRREEFQRNLVRSHACTLGEPLPRTFVRAALAVRAHVLAQGWSGVAPAVVEALIGMLNHGVHPVVREVGGVGASGDLVEVAQVALAVIGEGVVEYRGATMPASAALREVGLDPITPKFREGLALMNGTSFHTGVAAVLAARAHHIVNAAQVAAAMIFEALRANQEAIAPGLQTIRPHAGQRRVAERLAELVRDSALVRSGEGAAGRQDAYTLRCLPQVLGAVTDALAAAGAVIVTEINSISDNPIFRVDEQRVMHGGNFHGQPVAMALDQLKTALVEIGVLSERRLARLLDASLSGGLPPFLIRDGAGLRSGLMGLQYCASAMAADNAVLAAPASVRSVPTNANNQDVVSMGMVAARQAARVADNVARMVAIELLCAAEALDLRGVAHASTAARAAHACIRTHVARLDEDRPLTADVEAVGRLIEGGSLVAAVDAAMGGG